MPIKKSNGSSSPQRSQKMTPKQLAAFDKQMTAALGGLKKPGKKAGKPSGK